MYLFLQIECDEFEILPLTLLAVHLSEYLSVQQRGRGGGGREEAEGDRGGGGAGGGHHLQSANSMNCFYMFFLNIFKVVTL